MGKLNISSPKPKKSINYFNSKNRSKSKTQSALINEENILQAVVNAFPFCEVKQVDFATMSLEKQIPLSSKVSAPIGIHGSDLTNGIWMNRSIETFPTCIGKFLPYKYTCKKWFSDLARIFQIQYIPIPTLSFN
jgi:hypothetical protein